MVVCSDVQPRPQTMRKIGDGAKSWDSEWDVPGGRVAELRLYCAGATGEEEDKNRCHGTESGTQETRADRAGV